MKSLNYRDILLFHPPPLGCVLYLPGLPGSGSKIYERSPYGNIGALTGTVWVKAPGGMPCLSFDGADDYVAIANATSLQITGDLTLKTWARSTNYAVRNALFHKSYTYEYELHLYQTSNPNGRVFFWHNNQIIIDVQNVLPPINTWFHIVVVRDSTVRRCYLYINGILKYTSAVYAGTPPTSTNDVWLGRYLSEYMPGNMALVEIHNRRWQSLDVQNSFNREKNIFGVW